MAKVLTYLFLEKEYSQDRKSPYTIAEDVGCSPKTVYNYLEYYGIPINNMSLSIGEQFGWWTVKESLGSTANKTKQLLCECRCGVTKPVPSSRLRSGRSKSCGCYRKRKRNHRWTGYCGVTGSMVADIRVRAKKKNRKFNIDAKFLWELYEQQGHQCSISNLFIVLGHNASVDRIDSCKGYIKDNVQWVHKDINIMKNAFDQEYFILMCGIIADNRKEAK